MSLETNQRELAYWESRGHTVAELEEAFSNAEPHEQLFLLSWEGSDFFNIKTKPGLLEEYRAAIVAFFAHIICEKEIPAGAVLITTHDAVWTNKSKEVPIFGFCKRKDDPYTLLVPDPQFIAAHGQDEVIRNIRDFDKILPWEYKIPGAFWRGTSTGLPLLTREGWRENLRVKLCIKSLEANDSGFLDAYFSEIVQCDDESVKEQIVNSGLLREPINHLMFGRNLYLIDIDGNASSWGYFWKLCFNGVVLKVDSPYMQWFYPFLVPGEHYLPVKSDLSDLFETIRWARNNDARCREISENASVIMRQNLMKDTVRQAANVVRRLLKSQRPG